VVSTDLSFLFANKTAGTLDTSGHHEIGRRQENNKTAETLDMEFDVPHKVCGDTS